MKKAISLVLSAVVLLSSVFCFSAAALANGCFEITINGSYDYDLSYQAFNLVNSERKKAGLSPLGLDEELQGAAFQRASELLFLFEHIRPNGEECFSVSGKAYGENIAAGYNTAQSVVDAWMESESHEDNILYPYYESVGIGCFVIDGIYLWVQLFGIEQAQGSPQTSGLVNGQSTIEISTDFVDPEGIAPTNFKVAGRGDGGKRLRLEWTGIEGALGYKIYNVTNGKKELIGDTKETTFTFTDLNPAWEYDIKVCAYDGSGEEIASVYRICAATAPVSDFEVRAKDNQITASWSEQACHGYYIQWSTDPSFSKNVNGKYIDGSWTKNTTINVSNAENYYVRIRAWKWYNGERIYGDFTSSAPASFVVAGRGDGGKSLRLEWNAVKDAVKYDVYAINKAGTVFKGTVTEPKIKFTDLTPAWEYDIKVIAYDKDDRQSSAVYRICAAVAPVENFSAYLTSANEIKASWDDGVCHGYYIQWATDKDFTQNVGGAYINNTFTKEYTISSSDAQNYYVRIRAWKLFNGAKIYSDFCEPVDLTQTLPVPSGFVVAGRGDGGKSLRLEWNAVDGAAKYDVYATNKQGTFFKGTVTEPKIRFTDLTPAWEYDITVIAYDEQGRKSSAVYRICAALAPVEEFEASENGNQIQAQWKEQACHGYYIQWSTDPSFAKNVIGEYIGGSWTTSAQIDVSHPENYYVRVRAWKWYNGERIYSDFSQPVKAS